MQKAGVSRIGRFVDLVARNGIWLLRANSISLRAGTEIPFAPWRNHLDVGLQRVIAELEPDLIVTFASGAKLIASAPVSCAFLSGAWKSAVAIEVPSR